MERLRSHRISNESHLKRMARAHDISSVLAEYRNALESPRSLPSAGDIHTLPGVRDILLDGTDEEFAALKSDIVSRLPQLTAQCYEERRTTLMELLLNDYGRETPFSSLRPPSTVNHAALVN